MIVGTDPDDAISSFQHTLSLTDDIGGQRVQIEFSGKAGRTYKLLRKIDLLAPTWIQEAQTTISDDTTIRFDEVFTEAQSFFTIEPLMQ